MKITSLLLAALLVPVIAYSSSSRIPPPVERVENSTTYFLTPSIGESMTAEVGESLYQEGIKTTSKRYRAILKEGATSKMDRGYVLTVKAGAEGQMLMRPESHLPLLCFMTHGTGILGVFGDNNVVGCLVDSSNSQVFDASMFQSYGNRFKLSNPVPYEVKVAETTVENREDFYVDVLYQGVSKGEVKISYREFSSGVARPAFTQDVSYELEPNGTATIGFKGMRIKILKATSQNLQYVLEQPMPSMAKYRAEAKDKASSKPGVWWQ
jgi:hypothetical protein